MIDPPPWHDLCEYSTEQMKLAAQHNIKSPGVLWNNMKTAKYRFRTMTLPARAIAPDELLTALNSVESGFDEVFDAAIRIGEYNKWPADEYDDIIQPKIGDLVSAIREALK